MGYTSPDAAFNLQLILPIVVGVIGGCFFTLKWSILGLIENMIVGVLGAFIGWFIGWIAGQITGLGPFFGGIICAIIISSLFLQITHRFRKGKS
jgi:uncharacterized membrane protein YeaQ/YmgE (transglycosylase-associated protein family)